ncbi:bifunctional metallophosphatase/5'-nucleotidase [Deinococcus radiotolerans]|uniref:Multifunctional 2',3'-cyclic-nucleotide 2'-phosphodiesterase/5'-nucleotidase/3'-nucleotidase n=1 Tax=Deinococcus radiotolerans TaxID=1309407 RepID=A0ABQ2FKU4_9DEIO|nr:bifunctional metallophosphatase/5'-nucleotidase [Deinococcus radiotolerans]GGL04163.1 multifunctional 2',3'-cyclic-nucleotide 2'-phosphodiesterase/5'-nucleotidase/3'-nucleotidase [Deinococcus radiotolerans]
MKTLPVLLLTVSLGLTACTTGPLTPVPTNVTILGLNDFHGNLAPTSFTTAEGAKISAGGIEAIAAEVNAARKANPNTVLVGGGDLIGASPINSGLLRDEPAVYALNGMGMKVSALGNHEFDQGLDELFRMQNGGCASNDPSKACKYDTTYTGATFKWIGANVAYNATSGKTGTPFAPYIIQDVNGLKIAFVGAVTKSTPGIVSPDGVKMLNFTDEAAAVNKYIPEIKAKKPDAIIMLIHEGGELAEGSTDKYNTVGCKTLSIKSAIVDIAKRVDPAVSAIISGHSHQGYNCLVPDPTGKDRIVIQGDFYGHLLQRLDLVVDKANHRVMQVQAANLVVNYDARKADGTLDPNMTSILTKTNEKVAAIKNVEIAKLGDPQIQRGISNARNTESALGDVIADALVYTTQAQGSQIGLMNPGGIRADLPDATAIKAGNAVNFGDVFAVHPFGNTTTVLTLTGQQIKDLLEQQWSGANASAVKLLQVSADFSYKYTLSNPDGQRVNIADITFKGAPISATATYRVATNNFLAAGGDNFTVFKNATNVVQLPGLSDTDVLSTYLKAFGPNLKNVVQNRIIKL